MKKKSWTQAGFLNLRVLLGLMLCLAGVLLAFTAIAQRSTPEPTIAPPKIHFLTKAARSFNGDLRDLPKTRPVKKPPRPEFEPPDSGQSMPGAEAPLGSGLTSETSAPAPPPGSSFGGLGRAGGWGDGYPPDTNGDVGPKYYIQTINTALAVYDKSTGVVAAGPFSFDTLMSQGHFGNLCDTSNYGDPVVLYDSFSDRWILTDFAFVVSNGAVVAPALQCFAVSKTNDPVTGGWNYYSVTVSDALNDYDKLGVWPDGIYMSANMFGFGANGTFKNVRAWAFNKAQMYAGNPTVQVISFDFPSKIGGVSVFTVLPSNARAQTGAPPAGRENLFASVWGITNKVRVWKFHVDWSNTANSTLSTNADSNVAP